MHVSTTKQIATPLNVVTKEELLALQAAVKTALTELETRPDAAPVVMPPGWSTLKPGHQAVLRLIAGGHNTAAIAEKRCRSTHAIHSQRAAICRALNLRGNNCLLLFAERHRAWLLQTPDM